jgi:hypothetical protein
LSRARAVAVVEHLVTTLLPEARPPRKDRA